MDVIGDKPVPDGDDEDLDNDDSAVGVNGFGGGGVSDIIVDGLEPKWDVMQDVGTCLKEKITI